MPGSRTGGLAAILSVAAYRAQNFFDRPSVKDYQAMHKAAEKAKCWTAVREAVLRYLKTGQYPASDHQASKISSWPLPSPEVESPSAKKRSGHQRFPDLETLIDIAIMEKHFDDLVVLYQQLPKKQRWGWETDKKVAQAVANTHSDLALAIWKDIVNSLIAEVKPKAYEEASVYLRFMEKVYARNRRLEDFGRVCWKSCEENTRPSGGSSAYPIPYRKRNSLTDWPVNLGKAFCDSGRLRPQFHSMVRPSLRMVSKIVSNRLRLAAGSGWVLSDTLLIPCRLLKARTHRAEGFIE